MKHAHKVQRVDTTPAAAGVFVMPTVQVRRTTPGWSRKARAVAERILPGLLGLGLLLVAWQLAAINSKGFPTPLSTLDSAMTLFAIRSTVMAPMTWGSAGTYWPRCSEWGSALGWRRWWGSLWAF